jgi:hypothetical protein
LSILNFPKKTENSVFVEQVLLNTILPKIQIIGYLAPTEGKILLSRLVLKDETRQKIGMMAGNIFAENARYFAP